MRSHSATTTVTGFVLILGLAAGCSHGVLPVAGGQAGRVSTTSAMPGAAKTIAISITGGKVTPALGRVEITQGMTVRLLVTTDLTDQVHVHGYDMVAHLAAGRPSTLHWVADIPGVFDVETHRAGTLLVRLVVR